MLHRSGFPKAAKAVAGSSPFTPATGTAEATDFVPEASDTGEVTASLMRSVYLIPILHDKPDLDPFWRRLDHPSLKLDPETLDAGEIWRAFD